MAIHLAAISVISALISLAACLPFLPGGYDRLAVPLSDMAQVFGFVGLVFVPIGALWLFAELRCRRREQLRAQPNPPRTITIALTVAGALVVAVLALVAWAQAGNALALLTLALGGAALWRFATSDSRPRAADSNRLNPAPFYLLIVPTAVAIAQHLLAGPVAHWSRERVISESGPMIDAIEAYHAAHGKYPLSLASLGNDYKPASMGVERYYYEPNGDAFNLYFEHHTFRLGTQEIVMYNPRGEQDISSHDADLLELSPEQIEQQRGHYAQHEADTPHWKYFWFD